MNDGSSKGYSRRLVLRAGVAAMAGIGAAVTARADDSDKVAQSAVQYQQTPKDGNKCSLCVNWVAPNSCKVVAGTINPNGWCVAFAPKSS
jgi:hypothetical protein